MATLDWLDTMVIDLQLCPWARPAKASPGFRCVVVPAAEGVDEVDVAESTLVDEALRLRACQDELPTTLVVFHREHGSADLAGFARLTRRIQRRLRVVAPEIDVLAFHPLRCDSGPGCSNSPADAGHFSVRAPLPTLQLLRHAELDAARAQWSGTPAGRRHPDLPGALGLLYDNKARLRGMGTARLQELLNACGRGRAECAAAARPRESEGEGAEQEASPDAGK